MTLTWDLGGIEVKAAQWDPLQHPRDHEGKFIETGARIRWGLQLGKVLGNLKGDRIEVQLDNGQKRAVSQHAVTVVARPDGSAPTSDRNKVAASPVRAAAPDAIHEPGHPDDQAPAVAPTKKLASTDDLRAHLATATTGSAGRDAELRKAAQDPTLELSPGGHFAVHQSEGGKTWELFLADSGKKLGDAGENIKGGKPGALALAEALETRMVDGDGHPFDWSAPDLVAQADGWTSKDGLTLADAARKVRGDLNIGRETPTAKLAEPSAPDETVKPDVPEPAKLDTPDKEQSGAGRADDSGALRDAPAAPVGGDTGSGPARVSDAPGRAGGPAGGRDSGRAREDDAVRVPVDVGDGTGRADQGEAGDGTPDSGVAGVPGDAGR